MLTYYLCMIALFLVGVIIIYYNVMRRHLYIAASGMKGPTAFPFIGNGLMFLCKNEEVLQKINKVFKGSEDEPLRFWLGPKLLIGLSNPNHVEKILSSSKFAHKHDVYDFIKPYLGEGLVSGSGPDYKRHRRIIQPLFDLKFSNECAFIIQKHANICMEKLEKHVEKGTIDIHYDIHKCMVDFVGETILGKDMQCQVNGYSQFDKALVDVYNFGFTRLVKPWLHPDFIYLNSPYKKQHWEIVESLRELGNEVVINSWKRRKLSNIICDFIPIIDRIASHIELNPGSIEQKIFVDHLLTLHAAAEDTLTIISSFTALCLGMYPEYQKKVFEEIREVVGETSSRNITIDDINKLIYLDMCIKDVFRLFPIAPYILRKSMENYKLEKWSIPKDAALVIPIYNLHRDKRHWENPDHFHPDHFLPEQVRKRHIYSYVPFSAGPRGCIGKIMANTALKIFMCNLLQKYEIEADGKLPDLDLRMDISVRPKNGYLLRIKKRVWT